MKCTSSILVPRTSVRILFVSLLLLSLGGGGSVAAQQPGDGKSYLPDLGELTSLESSELRDVVNRFASDRSGLFRFHNVPNSAGRRIAARDFYEEWLGALDGMDFTGLGIDGRIDWVLFRNDLAYELALLEREERILAETTPLVPFMDTIITLQETRRRMQPVAPDEAARIGA